MLDPRTVAAITQRPWLPASRMSPGAWETAVTRRSSHRPRTMPSRGAPPRDLVAGIRRYFGLMGVPTGTSLPPRSGDDPGP